MKKGITVIFLLLLLTFPAVKSLTLEGGYTSHDMTYHIMRQISMDNLLKEGQFPPRWSGELNNGYGYPVFIFNYPLPGLVGEVFHKLGFNFVNSVKAVFFISMFISILGMYFFLKEFLNSKLSAILGSVFYLYAPIRFIDVYVAAALGAALAASILPFVFYFMVILSKKDLKNKGLKILFGALSFCLLILSHNFTAFIFAPVILSFAGLLIWQSRERSRLFQDFMAMFLLGLGLSAFFWLPASIEKQYLRFDKIYETFYQNQFISIPELIHSPWGYGLSHPERPEDGDMSYQLGLIHILVMITFIPFLWVIRKIKGVKQTGGFILIFFVLSVFMMLKVSLPVWKAFPILSIVQFPLRFEIVAVFCAAIASALFIKYFPYKKILFVFLLFSVLYANRNHWKINEVFNPGENYYTSLKGLTSPYGEDLPNWARGMDKKSPGKFEFITVGKNPLASSGGTIKIIEDKSTKVLAEVEATESSKLRFNQFYFPNWQIKVDGKVTNFNYLIDGEDYGLPVFDIGAGKHQILAEFKNTTDRNIADFISLASVVIFVLYLLVINNESCKPD